MYPPDPPLKWIDHRHVSLGGSLSLFLHRFSFNKTPQEMTDLRIAGQRFRQIPRVPTFLASEADPLLNENLDPWPHLKELVRCYKADWVKDDLKYGHYERVPFPSFENQIFEGPDTDIERELQLANLRQGRNLETVDDEDLSTSGRHSPESSSTESTCNKKSPKHLGDAPLPFYEPVFDWETKRASITGQSRPEVPSALSFSGIRVSVKVLSLTLQAGFVEPFYGTICLYHRERREKISEDFHFQFLPSDFQAEGLSVARRAVFSLESPSASVCLLIQVEKHATEEGGVRSSVYSRKEPIYLTEREKQKLKVWGQMMPYREPFAWAAVPLFDLSITGGVVGGFGSPGSPLPPGQSGATNGFDVIGRTLSQGKIMHDTGGTPIVVEIPALNRVKENYTEDFLQDPKRKVSKPVKATLRLEVERLTSVHHDIDVLSETSSVGNASVDGQERAEDPVMPKTFRNGSSGAMKGPSNVCSKLSHNEGKEAERIGLRNPSPASGAAGGLTDFYPLDFRTLTKSEPFTQILHCLYVYPISLNLSRKWNLFIRVELRKDDTDFRKSPLEAIYPSDGGSLLKEVHSQIAANARTANYHDEIKVQLPAILTPQHHLLFTFHHIDLMMKLEAPKPATIGYSILPLSLNSQLLRSDISLPIIKEIVPHYLQESVQEKLDYLEDGRAVFRLRLRLCSTLYSVNERVRDFFIEYDRHILRTSPPWGSELLEAINGLKTVDSTVMLQFLQPIFNMLLQLIADGGETLQVAAFRAMVNILTRVQQESTNGAERNKFLVQYLDYMFDDFGGYHSPVYPGLCTVWGSLARSKAKGYRVGPVYDDVLSMAWVFLELIVKSMGLEQAQVYSNSLPLGEEVPPLPLKDGVFRCVGQLFDCLLTEVYERSKKGLSLVKQLNSSLAFFCCGLLSVIEPCQVYELVALYIDKFSGVCQPSLHECKLTFLQIICDHDLFVELPGRDPSERNYLSSVLGQELFLSWDHDDPNQRAKAARILVNLMCKHEFDARYQKQEDKLYIAQLYFPLVGQILDEMPVFHNLSSPEKREVLVCMLQIIHNLDEASLVKVWQQSVARTRLFFKLLEEGLSLFEYRKSTDGLLMASASRNSDDEGIVSPRYSDRLSPAVHGYLADASKQDIRPHVSPENGYIWHRLSPQFSSPSQPYSLREALAQAHSLRIGSSNRALREGLHPMLRKKLEIWEENLTASVSLEVLEILDKFSEAVSNHNVASDYVKLDCITSIIMGFLSRSQPLSFWKAYLPVFNKVFRNHGEILMARENDRFLKQVAFHLLHLTVYRNISIRKRAVVGLQILFRNSFFYFPSTGRLRVMLTITLSELMSDVQVTQMRSDASLVESSEAQRLRKSLQVMASKELSQDLLKECSLPKSTLNAIPRDDEEVSKPDRWCWAEVSNVSATLLSALNAGVKHALLGTMMASDKYAAAESFYNLALAYALVPDLHIMWLLHLCDAHQEMQSWAEAAQCAVAVAGVIMQALVGRSDAVWGQPHVNALRKICPMLSTPLVLESLAAEVEGYGASKLTADSAVKYLQLSNKLFSQAELYHFCAKVLELIIPVYKNKHAYPHLAKCHTALASIYNSIVVQESGPLPFIDATYYRVGFYGNKFGKRDRKEYVYREARDVRLGDIMEKLSHIYESRLGGNQMLHIIPDSRQVNANELQAGVCYLQITSVDPVLEDEDLESRRERVASHLSSTMQARVFDRFLFDTPFTKNGKTQGGLEDQWRRRTVLQTEGSFPALVNRLLIRKSESQEFSPIENAIGMIETRTAALQNELEDHRSQEGGEQQPRLQSLQRILQGSVAVQVNSGVLGVCTAFLSGEPAAKLRSQELQQLIAALLEFMAVCKRAIKVHSRLIGEEDQDFHSQLVNGFQSLTAELSHYIPAILSEL